MKVFNKSSLLFFLFIIAFSIPTNAVIDYKPDTEKKTTIVQKQKQAKKKGFLKRWKEKLILKKWKKAGKKSDTNSNNKKANSSLLSGLISSLSLLYIYLFFLKKGFFTFPLIALFLAACLMALIGIFISILVLIKTKNSKEDYKKERRKAIWGINLFNISSNTVNSNFGFISKREKLSVVLNLGFCSRLSFKIRGTTCFKPCHGSLLFLLFNIVSLFRIIQEKPYFKCFLKNSIVLFQANCACSLSYLPVVSLWKP